MNADIQEGSQTSPKAKRFPCGAVLVFLAVALGILGLCGRLVIKGVGGTCFDGRPESIANPPVLANAEQIEFGKSSFEPDKGYIGKLTQFQTSDSPKTVYTFYLASLGKDAWYEDHAQHVMNVPNIAEAKFDWECTTLESTQEIAMLWLHAETIDSGKTVVTLNYEYVAR